MMLGQAARRAPGRGTVSVAWYSFSEALIAPVMHTVWRLRIQGRENVPRTGAFILAPNHQSMFDPVVCGIAARDRPLTYIARNTLFDFGPFGRLIRGYGAVGIVRNSPDAGAIKTALAELAAGRALLLYPEGTRCKIGQICEFKPGVVLLARRAKVPLVPLVLEGAYDIWPRGRTFPRLTGAIEAEVCPPIMPDEMQRRIREGSDLFLETLRKDMEEARLRCRQRLRERTHGKWPPPGVADKPYWSE